MNTIRCALVVVIFGAAPIVVQAQHQVDVPRLPPTIDPRSVNINPPVVIQAPLAGIGNHLGTVQPAVAAAPTDWVLQQSEALLDIMRCYLDPPSLANEVSAEKKESEDPKDLVEQRIKFLKLAAQHNTVSHCK